MAKKKKVKPTKEGGLKQFLASPQFAIVRGSFYVLFAAFAAIAILSYVLWYIKLGLEPSRTVNWCGTFGGWLASVLVSGSFGLASLGLCFLLFVYGLRLIVTHHKSKSEKAPRRTLWRDDRLFRKTLWSVIFWVMWLCTTIGWLANPENGDQYTLGAALSGVVGTELARLLYGLLHIGLPILQLFLACMFLFLVHNVRFHLPERKECPQEDATPQEVVEETDDEEEEEKKPGFIQRLFGRHKEDVDSDDEDDENEGWTISL